ncbi:MAG: HAMP domain-containing histidine kinase, partial [Oscillospiraceae bacterium]|nr:HAMP domain-containing histidine kinase [Oscillospiraceae bacterium]
ILGKKIDEKEFHSDVEKSDYEFFEFSRLNSKEYPVATLCNVHGTQETIYNELLTQVLEWCPSFKNQGVERGMFALSDTRRIYYSMMPVQINGKTQKLLTAFQIEFWNDQIKQAFYKILLIFFLACEVLAFLISLHKNKINKLAYQYEDYQRALTNNLAHDLKTPLMAIQGYAENLLTFYKMENQPKEYLESILDNISYTDSLINQTLKLNKMQEIKSLKKSSCNLNQLTEQAFKKYALLLEQRNIQVSTDGKAEISANLETLSSAIENLISNAVKYTTLGGEIKINISNKAFQIVNTVSSRTDTTELLLPFTKGDKSRTGKSGSGLGLSIANQALLANGFKLEISCTETEFTAKIHF